MESNDIEKEIHEIVENDTGTRTLIKSILSAQYDIQRADWKPDKAYTAGGNIVKYVSLTKMKATLAPILRNHGLVIGVRFDKPEQLEPAGKLSQHWMIKMTVSLSDMDGNMMVDEVWGEAGDLGDKGITKAESFAFKQWLTTKFMIADGIDEDMVSEDVSQPTFSKPRKTAEEKEEVVSKVLAQDVKNQTVKEEKVEPAPESEPEPAKEKKKEKPKEEPKEETKTEPEEKEETPAEAPSEPQEAPTAPEAPPAPPEPPKAPSNGFQPSAPQKVAIQRITDAWEKRAKEGKITPEVYNEMSMACASIASSADAVNFIRKYRVG